MAETAAPRASGRAARGESLLVAALALAAGLRIVVFAAAFPFFTNVDEHRHVDMVLKYARGYVPLPDTGAYESEMPWLLTRYASPEYHAHRDRRLPPPVWSAPPGVVARREARIAERLAGGPNLEASQPPVYYAMAGGVLFTLRALGLETLFTLYGVRALGGVFGALLVATSWWLLRETHPDAPLVRLGVPALLAAFPLDAVFYVTPDAASPLLVAAAFALALRVALVPDARPIWAGLAGLAAGAALLAKYTNAMAVVPCAAATLWILRSGEPRPALRRLVPLWVAFALPVSLWLVRNRLLFGSVTATETKVAYLGWRSRPLAEWWGHPLVSLGGAADFVTGLIPMFWRGEIVWHREVLALPWADVAYTSTSVVAFGLAAWGLRRARDGAWLVEAASLATCAFALATLAALSLSFVFHETSNPPADRPWFVNGRLVSGALLPFAIVYVAGIHRALAPLPGPWAPRVGIGLLAAAIAVALGSEVALTAEVFASSYNLYHLP